MASPAPSPVRPARSAGARFGLDDPMTFALFVGEAVSFTIAGLVILFVSIPIAGAVMVAVAVTFGVAFTVQYRHVSGRGKLRLWDGLLDELALRGDERVIDLGCGTGAALCAVAGRLDAGGRAVGVDLWHPLQQWGNALDRTVANVAAAGVADRVEVRTGDVKDLPDADGSFDVVLSSFAIGEERIPGHHDRVAAEALRLLRPGGRLVVVERDRIQTKTSRWRETLAAGLDPVAIRRAGWRLWWGHPWGRTWIVTGTKPTSLLG